MNTPTERIAALSARLRTRPRRRSDSRPPIQSRRHRCSFCGSEEHKRPRCAMARLAIWTNGAELWIAASAEDAAALEADFFNNPAIDDLREDSTIAPTPAGEWWRVEEEPLELIVEGKPDHWTQKAWICANGRPGLLTFADRELASGRRVPG